MGRNKRVEVEESEVKEGGIDESEIDMGEVDDSEVEGMTTLKSAKKSPLFFTY